MICHFQLHQGNFQLYWLFNSWEMEVGRGSHYLWINIIHLLQKDFKAVCNIPKEPGIGKLCLMDT